MKIGASYNLFDGEELLEFSIMSIRDSVDYISVVYQTESNVGNYTNTNVIPLLINLKESGLIDELVYYQPNLLLKTHRNEVNKRNIGLKKSLENGCSYHISMDTDELYNPSDFKKMVDDVIENKYDGSYCQMLTYYKDFNVILDPPEEYYVSLLFKINEETFYNLGCEQPVQVDNTRSIMVKNPRIYTRNEIQMHHLSFVRKDITKKFRNHQMFNQYGDNIEKVIDCHKNFGSSKQDKVLLHGEKFKYSKVKLVDNVLLKFKLSEDVIHFGN